ncbi:MAG TPA: hypothetical protein VGV89_07925 [Thermoplasmata archaeon]|nr:hypothetical protein [Thermoplasmata archaeon]
MSEDSRRTLVSTWFGAFVVEGDRVVTSAIFDTSPELLAERLAERREGRLVAEEEGILARELPDRLSCRDRRFESRGVHIGSPSVSPIEPESRGHSLATLREVLLARAHADLARSWDPSIHVQEAVRALVDAEEVMNSVGERLALWAQHDRPAEGPAAEGLLRLARRLVEGVPEEGFGVPPPDPSLAAGRQALARLYLTSAETRSSLERSLEEAMPRHAPNLTALLGPMLAARMIAQAGSLERLSALPASTIQVLGAEKAFFEHLRGRAPPPRHGLLFLHPKLHSAPRTLRGRLARALAGKVAIAARLDRAGRPLDPTLKAQFETRAARAAATPVRGGGGRPRGRRSVRPLHRASEDR